MKLPWISRHDYDLVTTQLTASRDASIRYIDALVAELRRADDRFNTLFASYHSLKLQGFSEATPQIVPPPPTPDPVMDAINAVSAGKDAKVRAGMIRQAARDKKAGLDPEEIVARIYRGHRPGDEMVNIQNATYHRESHAESQGTASPS